MHRNSGAAPTVSSPPILLSPPEEKAPLKRRPNVAHMESVRTWFLSVEVADRPRSEHVAIVSGVPTGDDIALLRLLNP